MNNQTIWQDMVVTATTVVMMKLLQYRRFERVCSPILSRSDNVEQSVAWISYQILLIWYE